MGRSFAGQTYGHRSAEGLAEVHDARGIDIGAARQVCASGACITDQTGLGRGPAVVAKAAIVKEKRRDVMVAGLNKIEGFSCRLPKGAFYVFPNITKTGWPSKKLADALLDDAGVAALSGTAFGDFGEGYLRFCFARDRRELSGALDSMKQLFR